MAGFNIKSELDQEETDHVGLKECRNMNLGHSEQGENYGKKGGKEKEGKEMIRLSDHYLVVIHYF